MNKQYSIQDFINFAKSEINSSYMNPYILEERKLNVTQMDVFSRLMRDRIIYFTGPVDEDSVKVIVAQLLYLDSVEKKDITLYIDSPGGSVLSGYGLLDTMQFVGSPVSTVNMGLAASMGAMTLMCGNRGKRKSLPHARTMIHQPLGGARGQASDILIEAEQIRQIRTELYEIIAQRTGQDIEKIKEDADRNYWMTAPEALEYGIIDEIININWD